MKKITKSIKFLGASFLSVGSLSIFFAAYNNSSNAQEVRAAVDYSACETAHNSGDGDSLLTALRSVTSSGTPGSYANLWTTYTSAYVTSSGYIKDYYSSATSFTPSDDQCGSYTAEGSCYNREHSIPKSWWGSGTDSGTQGCDPFFVVPTDGYVNNKRSNYPLGEVSSSTYASSGSYSLLGTADTSYGYSGTVFEPNDEVKGDFARMHFYVIAKYSASYGWTSGYGTSTFSGSSSTNYGLTDYAVKLFTAWNELDPPDDWEESVNSALYSIQGNTNPFIDHPEYVNTLWGDVSGATTYTGSGSSSSSTTTGITSISSTSISLTVDETSTISAVSSDSSTITWSTSDSSIASISATSASSGSSITITGVAAGTATITAKATIDGTSYTKTCSVTVSSSGSGTSGSTASGDYSIVFSTGTNGSSALSSSGILDYTSENTLVNSFSECTKCYEGTSGLKLGSSSYSGSFTAVPVSAAQSNVVSISFSSTVYSSDTGTLTLSVNGTNVATGITVGEDYTYTFDSASSVTSFGLATSSKRAYIGAVYFTLEDSSSGSSSSTEATVTSVTVSPSTLSLDLNGTTSSTLSATVTGTNSPATTVTWSSSDTSVATVSSSGTVTAVATGTATITATSTADTSKSGTCTVTVSDSSSSSSGSSSTTTTTYELVTDGLSAGDEVLISAMSSQSATTAYTMTNTYNSSTPWYLKSASTTVTDSKVEYDSSSMKLWTVGGSSSAGYTFTPDSGSNYLRGYYSSSHYSIACLDSTYGDYPNNWSMTYTSGSGYTMSVAADATVYLEFSGTSYNTFKGYSSAPTDWYINFFRKTTTTSSSETAETFASAFLSAITCDSTGASAPTFASGYSWSELSSQFSALDSTYQSTLQNADANESGTTIEQAMARYDYIVAKYSYDNFINRTISNSANRMNMLDNSSAINILVVFGVTAVLTGITFVAYYLKKRKQED